MRRSLALLLVLIVLVVALPRLRSEVPAAERGRELAARFGCFGCHGPDGTHGSANPGRTDRTVPGFGSDVMMYAKTPDEIRQWIEDGVTAARAHSRTWQEQRDRGVLRMPAYRRRLGRRQIDDLVAFVQAMAGVPEPEDSLAVRGLERAEALGCTGCHGAGGRFSRRNPGSFRGRVPAWSGQDFPELVRDRAEFAEWVEEGASRRFRRNALAGFFLSRGALRMPAFRRHLEPGDLDALWAYVQWLRSPAGRP